MRRELRDEARERADAVMGEIARKGAERQNPAGGPRSAPAPMRGRRRRPDAAAPGSPETADPNLDGAASGRATAGEPASRTGDAAQARRGPEAGFSLSGVRGGSPVP